MHSEVDTRRERMMPPVDKMGYCQTRAQALADNQQVNIDGSHTAR